MGYYRWQWLIGRKIGFKNKKVEIPPLLPFEEREIEIEILPIRRGFIRFKGFSIIKHDPFGLFLSKNEYLAEDSILVLPKIYDIPNLQLPGLL